MANEKRLIDANALEEYFHETKITEIFPYWENLPRPTQSELIKYGKAVKQFVTLAPTIEAAPVVHGRWVSMGPHQGHKCGVCNDYYTDDAINLFYCPRCAAKMVEIEKLDYRRNGMPIGAPYRKTVCKHGRMEDNGNTL